MDSLDAIEKPTITRFIAHIVDHRTRRLALTDLETPIDDKFPVGLFESYILHAVEKKRELRRLARFRPQSTVGREVQSLAADPSQFVEAS